MLLFATIFFCTLSIAQQDCNMETAKHWERVPEGQALPFRCFQNAQVWAAENELIPAPPGEYYVIRCSKHSFGNRIG